MGIRALAAALALIPAAAGGQAPQRNVATLPFAAGVVAIEARADGHVVVGGASGDSTLAVVLRTASVSEWADSMARILAARRGRRRARDWRSTVTDSASGAGISFSRHTEDTASTYGLYFSNASYSGFPFALSLREARLFLEKLRLGVRTARRMAAPWRAPRR